MGGRLKKNRSNPVTFIWPKINPGSFLDRSWKGGLKKEEDLKLLWQWGKGKIEGM